LHDLHLAHLQGEDRAGLSRGRGVPHDVQREARLSEARASGEEDEVRSLEAAGLGVEGGEAGGEALVVIVGARADLIGEAAQRDIERHDVAVQVRLAHREQQLLRVHHRALRVLARQREMGDLVGRADEASQQGGALDDRRVGLGVRDRGDVLHEADEELRAADRVELAARREVRLHALEAQRLTALPHAFDRAEHETMRLARELRRGDATADGLLVDVGVDEDRAEEARLGLRLLRRRLRPGALERQRHTGIWSSAALLKKRACSPAKRSWKMPVGPLRFFATLPWMRRGAPAGVSSLSFQSMSTMSASCSMAPELCETMPSASQDAGPGTVRSNT